MLNAVHIEGIVTSGGWAHDSAQFIRLAVYRDTHLPRKPRTASGRQDAADFVTLRCEGQLALAAQAAGVGDRVRVTGVLVTRDYDIPLQRFANRVRNGVGGAQFLAQLRALAAQSNLALPHSLTEVLVHQFIITAKADPPAAGPDRPAPSSGRGRREQRSVPSVPPAGPGAAAQARDALAASAETRAPQAAAALRAGISAGVTSAASYSDQPGSRATALLQQAAPPSAEAA